MTVKRYSLVLALAFLIGSLLPLNLANAVTMSPIRLELSADPGDQTSGIVKVYNDDRTERTLYLSVAKFESKDESGQPMFVDGTDQLVEWIDIAPSIVVPPQESKEVPFTVSIPKDVDPGGYFAAIFASVIPPAPGEGMVAVQSDVGTLLLFRVNGEFPEGEAVLEFSTKDKKKVYNHLPVEFYYRFQNSGADRARPLGDITIRNTVGRISKIISANQGAGNVLPQSIRRFETAWVTAGGDKVEVNHDVVKDPELKSFWEAVKYQASNFALGYYSADLQLTVNNDASRTYLKNTSFWVIPWQLLLVILAIILIFVLPLLILFGAILIYFRRRKAKRKQ